MCRSGRLDRTTLGSHPFFTLVRRKGSKTRQSGGDLATHTLDVYTADKPNAGTSADVWVTLIGSEARSKRLRLSSEGLVRGEKVTIPLNAGHRLGALKELLVETNAKTKQDGWHLEKIVIHTQGKTAKSKAVCNETLSPETGLSRTLRVVPLKGSSKSTKRSGRRRPCIYIYTL